MLDNSGAVLLILPFQLAVAGASDADSPTMSDKTSESRLLILGTLHIFTFLARFSNT